MILHLEAKVPFETAIATAIKTFVRDVDFTQAVSKTYSNILRVTLDPDLSPETLKLLSSLVIMRRLKAYEFVGIEAKVVKNNDFPLLKDKEQLIIEALFINKR